MHLRLVLFLVLALTCVATLAGSSAFAAGEEIVVETSPLTPAAPQQWVDHRSRRRKPLGC